MATVALNGVELFYQTAGEGERLVLTHGAWTNSDTWAGIAPRLAESFEVVTWDRRGHSRSHGDPGDGSLAEGATDLAALIEHLGGGATHLIGNSAGGEVALHLLASRPDLVASAAVHEPGNLALLADTDDDHLLGLIARERQVCEGVVEMIEEGRHEQAATEFMEIVLGPGGWEMLGAELRATLVSNAATFPGESEDPFDPDSLDVATLSSSSAPLMISYGTDSTELLRASTTELARRLPNSRLEVLSGCGHIPHRTHPDVYLGALTAFYDSVNAGAWR